MKPLIAIIKRELWSVLRDFTIMISIVIQVVIASFSSGMLQGLLSLYDADTIMQYSGAGIKIGVVAPPGNDFQPFLDSYKIRSIAYASQTDAENAYALGQIAAIIIVPADPAETLKLYLPNADALSSLIRMILQEPLKQYETHLRGQNGIEVRYTGLKGLPTTNFEFIYSALIPLLMFFPAFVAGSMTVDSLTEEVENNTLQTLLSAPLSINGILNGKIAAAVLLSTMQCISWLGLMHLNGIVIQNLGWVLTLAVVVAGITSVSAMLGAALLRDRERSQFVYSLSLLAAVALSTLLDVSPLKTISRLAIGDYYTSGLNVAFFGVILLGLWLLLMKTSHRLVR